MMEAMPVFPFVRAAATLSAYQSNARDAIRWAHRSWIEFALDAGGRADGGLGDLLSCLEAAARPHVDRCSRALLRKLGIAAPSLETLGQPGAAVLDALPAEQGLQVLRMRALLFRRAQVRRLIDKRTRVVLAEWAGIGLDRLLDGGDGGKSAPDLSRFVLQGLLPSLDRADADRLAWEGCALVMRDLRALNPPFPLLRLALPRQLPGMAWFEAGAGACDPEGTAVLFEGLKQWLPEWAWLFG
jgi:type III secretion system HrpB4-like protein